MVREVLNSDLDTVALVFREGMEDRWDLPPEEPEIYLADEKSFSAISDLQSPEGVLAIVQMPSNASPNEITGPAFILDGIQDPGNLGAIMRIADWFGMKYLICGNGTVDLYNPKSVRSSMGALLRVKVVVHDHLNEWVRQHAAQIWIAHTGGISITELDLKSRNFLLIGNEANGVDSNIREMENICEVSIPGTGGAESLNAAVAAGILAWEMATN